MEARTRAHNVIEALQVCIDNDGAAEHVQHALTCLVQSEFVFRRLCCLRVHLTRNALSRVIQRGAMNVPIITFPIADQNDGEAEVTVLCHGV